MPQPVIIVSGLPRSGTSLCMQMLEAGGMPVRTDRMRGADTDNPRGYYEDERVRALADEGADTAWLADCRGKALKVVSPLLFHLPSVYDYRVLFLRRNMDEILASQAAMLERRRRKGLAPDAAPVDDVRMAQYFQAHLEKAAAWLAKQPNMKVMYVEHATCLDDPQGTAGRMAAFLASAGLVSADLDAAAMASVVDPELHRQRGHNIQESE